jgi:hypothetical protein
MKRDYIWLAVFILALVVFASLTTKIIFHDAPEYITIAKNFAGINNLDLYTTHSLLYPLVISPFLKIWPNPITLKLINSTWILLIALVLLTGLKNRKAFILFAFSPLVWYVGIQTTPMLPASFFFLLGYLFFKTERIKFNYLYSGICMGLACAFYDVLFLIIAIFILVNFFDKRVSTTLFYSIFVIMGLLPRLILDMVLFKMPFYSILKFFGANAVISLGLNSSNNMINASFIGSLLVIIAISPLLFKIYKVNFKEYKRDLIFLIIAFVILLLRAPMLKYFLVLAPILLIMLSEVLTKKEIKIHCLISLILIIFLAQGYFGYNEDSKMQSDIQKIIEDYQENELVAGPYQANNLAVFLWENHPRIYWYEDFIASRKNQTTFKKYELTFQSKITLREDIGINIVFNRNSNKTYENPIFILKKTENSGNLNLDKCYEVLCAYRQLDLPRNAYKETYS